MSVYIIQTLRCWYDMGTLEPKPDPDYKRANKNTRCRMFEFECRHNDNYEYEGFFNYRKTKTTGSSGIMSAAQDAKTDIKKLGHLLHTEKH